MLLWTNHHPSVFKGWTIPQDAGSANLISFRCCSKPLCGLLIQELGFCIHFPPGPQNDVSHVNHPAIKPPGLSFEATAHTCTRGTHKPSGSSSLSRMWQEQHHDGPGCWGRWRAQHARPPKAALPYKTGGFAGWPAFATCFKAVKCHY